MTDPTSTPDLRLKSILESLLLVSEKPIPFAQLQEVLDEHSEEAIRTALTDLTASLSSEGSGIDLVEVAGGYQLRTKAENSPWIFKLNKARPVRLSRASLETLAIVAYRQPVTRPEIDDIRGVDSGPVLRTLLERNFVRILGKREEAGSPLIYGTTKDFLSFFNLRNLGELPSLREYTELGEESLAKLEQLMPRSEPSEETMAQLNDLSEEEADADSDPSP
ncbi:MAG: SMC-Scp complex subunit ScpB [Pseudomonadota bacterium]